MRTLTNPHAGDVGEEWKHIELEPLTVPEVQPVTTPQPEPTPV